MATLKVYDGTSWQVVAGQGSPGWGVPAGGAAGTLLAKATAANGDTTWVAAPQSLPTGGTQGQRLVKASGTNYDVAWDGDNAYANWTQYTPRFATDGGYEGGMTAGSGGGNTAWYRMIAPYTMAIYTYFQWGSSGGNGGAAGNLLYSIPSGYTATGNSYQYLDNAVWTGDGFTYDGISLVNPNDIWLRPRYSFAGPIDRYVGVQSPVNTSGNPMAPVNFYPSGGVRIWGHLQVNQRW